jgi:hypothetical protein
MLKSTADFIDGNYTHHVSDRIQFMSFCNHEQVSKKLFFSEDWLNVPYSAHTYKMCQNGGINSFREENNLPPFCHQRLPPSEPLRLAEM